METVQKELMQAKEILGLFTDLQSMNDSIVVDQVIELPFPKQRELKTNEVCFYRVNQLAFDEDYPRREAFENVLLSMENEAFNFVYVLTGTEEGIELCIGVVQNQNENLPVLGKKLSAVNYGEIISSVFEGNFNGSNLKKLKGIELDNLIGTGSEIYKNAGVITGIPSLNENTENSEYDFQGIDRLINTMLGLEWRLVVVCEPVSKKEILKIREDVYELYNRFSLYSKRTVQHSESDGASISFGKNKSYSEGKNWGYSRNDSKSSGKQGETWNSSKQHSEGNTEGVSRDYSKGENQGVNVNKGISNSVTIEIANKHTEEIMDYINENLLERLKRGYSKGLFKTSVYYMAKEPTHASRLKVGIMSLFQGNKSTYSPLHAQSIDLNNSRNKNMLRIYQNQYLPYKKYSDDALLLLGRPFYKNYTGVNSYLTTDEISLIAGMPQKEVPGLTLKEGVGFGLNEKNIDKEKAINLGYMVQKGRELKKNFFYLSRESMAKHTFIAGVTGSGKTTTCHKLLEEAKMPFLVIEPAKTEYRTLIKSQEFDDVIVFTLGDETVAPFRINPFELIEGEVISAHVDMIKATFTSAFPMEASMPQILEEAIYKCYKEKAWNINTNENDKYGEKAYDSNVNSFPTMSDLLEKLKEVVKSKNFGPELAANYEGSLVSRLSNLTVGSKGNMLNCEHSTDFEYIAEHNIILEMEELKSSEDKALFMGFVLSRLSAVIKKKHRENPQFKHLTLIEEAHRLLSKVEYGDSGSKKAAVETFTDLLAEVRKYGEGIIIVDQIPNKLAPEVLKNTNTKIIHKILAKDDKEAVGDAMLMNDKQKMYLSALSVGEAIVFSDNTDMPVHVHITKISDTNEEQIKDEIVRERFMEHRRRFKDCYKYLEIDDIYPQFERVVKEVLKKIQVDENECLQLKSKVEKQRKIYNETKEEIWDKLIRKWDFVSGKLAGSLQNQEERIKILKRFFVETFYKENFSENDITVKIYSVLA